jgi:serpin B
VRVARGVLAALALTAALWPAASPDARAVSVNAAAASPARAENGFALALLHQLGGAGNLVYSPYSIDLALTMADAGAEGQTASQIASVLDAPSASDAASYAGALRHALEQAVGSGSAAPTLDVANALWTQSGLALQAQFVATLTDDFGAPPQSTDFAESPAAALAAINGWVSQHTDALIPDLLGQGSITPQTAFVLANAIYLKARWQSPFAKSQTAPAAFTTATGQVLHVPFMNQADTTYGYASATGYQAIELPYSSSSLSMLAILPRGKTLARFARGLTAGSLGAIVGALRPASVNLSMPKLDLSTQSDLDGPLQKLGMTDAFTGHANFAGVTTQRQLEISLVEHAAVLKVDEQGTVAAGATAIVAPTTAVPVRTRTIDLKLNRPYLLALRDDASGALLFVALVANPAQS